MTNLIITKMLMNGLLKTLYSFIKELLKGFFHHMFNTLMVILFTLFLRRWFLKFVNNNLQTDGYRLRYYFDGAGMADFFQLRLGGIFQNNIEIISLNHDLRVRIKNETVITPQTNIRVFTVNGYRIPLVLYWNIFSKIALNKITNKLRPDVELSANAFKIKLPKELKDELMNEFSQYEANTSNLR